MSQIESVKCTKCAAPLKLLGGGRVATVTCSYCKSVLDLNDNYKVLSNFRNIKAEHNLPFDIGMKGTLKGIEYTIIGRVTYADMEYPHGEWSDFLLFSPLYGYAWLTYEEGTLIYSRRNRTFPSLSWHEITEQSRVVVDGQDYEPYDVYSAKISYVEGELTWVAKKNDNVSFIDLIAPPLGLSVERSKEEIEYYKTEYLEADEVYDAFAVPSEKRESDESFHPLKPFSQPFFKALSVISIWVLIIVALLFVGVKIDGDGKVLSHFSANNVHVEEQLFTLSSNRYLTSIKLKAVNANSLNNFNMKLHKDDKLLFSLTKDSAYTFDHAIQKVDKKLLSWEKSAKEVMVYLNLEALGVYKLSILPVNSAVTSTVVVTVKEKSARVNYLMMFALFVLIALVLYYLLRWRYRRKLQSERALYDKGDDDNEEGFNWGNPIVWIILIAFLIYID